MYNYLVTTNISQVEAEYTRGRSIVMIDGTVPGWQRRSGDFHFDHHRPGGAPIQIAEIQDRLNILNKDVTFVTTQVDADACVAAAWIQILEMQLDQAEEYEIYRDLSAIAYDCDHLSLPAASMWDNFREFASKAVAALKEVSKGYVTDLGLPGDRKLWDEQTKQNYATYSFRLGTEWLIDAALNKRPWPGQSGEADTYFAEMESMRPVVYENCRTYKGCAIFDQRSIGKYIDPRLLVEWARENGVPQPITLTVRDGSKQPNAHLVNGYEGDLYSYTLGSVLLHSKGSPRYSDRAVWQQLAIAEDSLRKRLYSLPPAETKWGGRNEVGGSGWRDPVVTAPETVIEIVLEVLNEASKAEEEEFDF